MTRLAYLPSEMPVSRGRSGWPPKIDESVSLVWEETILSTASYRDRKDQVLAFHGDEVDQLFPSRQELLTIGINTRNLAACIMHQLVSVEHLADTFKTMSAIDFNASLELLLERVPAIEEHPDDLLEQSLHIQGHCCCAVQAIDRRQRQPKLA